MLNKAGYICQYTLSIQLFIQKLSWKDSNLVYKRVIRTCAILAIGIFSSNSLVRWCHIEHADLQIQRMSPRYISF